MKYKGIKIIEDLRDLFEGYYSTFHDVLNSYVLLLCFFKTKVLKN